MPALDALAAWPVTTAAGVVVDAGGSRRAAGPREWRTRIASVTKLLVAYACLVAVEEETLDLDAPAGPPGVTVRHLLAHASGLPFEGTTPLAAPGRRRIYSNTGFEVLGDTLADAAGIAVSDYLAEAVLEPLGMAATELLAPTLVAPATLAEATTEQFAGLAGVLPDMGRYDPNPWGLGFELKDAKSPHWTAPDGSPRTFGHFGGSGSFLWVDPDAGVACAVLTDRPFGDWAPPLWSSLSAAVLAEQAGVQGADGARDG